MKISVRELRCRLDYNPETGVFIWLTNRNSTLIGMPAGCLHKPTGYWFLSIGDFKYKGHIAAWAHYYGYWPNFDIDHKDLYKVNNAIKNLRPSDKSNNGANRPPQKNNTSGYKGVFWHEVARKWMVQIRVRNQLIYGGLFENVVDAAKAYDQIALQNFGFHARLNLVPA